MASHLQAPIAGLSVPGDRIPFPHDVDEFAQDDRISYSTADNKWLLVDDDGEEWEWMNEIGKWMPSVDEDMIEHQQEVYAIPGVDDTIEDPQERRRKRKAGDDPAANKRTKPSSRPKPERKNTAVYVTSIPLDATVKEVSDVFSKCGVIAEELESGEPRIKLYTDDEGKPKGDALIVYFRPESVNLAINLLDESDLRLGESGPYGPMRVKAADFSYKRQKEEPEKMSAKDKLRKQKKAQKMNNKLADWDDDDPSVLAEKTSRWDKVVVLKHMFTIDELKDDPTAILEIQDDIKEECSKLGDVKSVILFDREEEGVVSVRFTTVEAAEACVQVMHGRHFAGQKVVAYIADGSERFRKTPNKQRHGDEEAEKEEERRLEEFSQWLEEGKDGTDDV